MIDLTLIANVNAEVRERFANLATEPANEGRLDAGPTSAKRLGYDPATIDALPPSCTESFAGVGNPLAFAALERGDRVVDFGSGAGLDALLAARDVRPSGMVIGVDMTAEMVEKARANARALGLENVSFEIGELEAMPVPTGWADVVISNGVFNLCQIKPIVAAEMRRVLAPGGKLAIADMLLEAHVGADELAKLGTWSD
ncbi:MAG: hypothetical protein NVSMB21_23530 [Vulcanimicrobiaceae bacterium]